MTIFCVFRHLFGLDRHLQKVLHTQIIFESLSKVMSAEIRQKKGQKRGESPKLTQNLSLSSDKVTQSGHIPILNS